MTSIDPPAFVLALMIGGVSMIGLVFYFGMRAQNKANADAGQIKARAYWPELFTAGNNTDDLLYSFLQGNAGGFHVLKTVIRDAEDQQVALISRNPLAGVDRIETNDGVYLVTSQPGFNQSRFVLTRENSDDPLYTLTLPQPLRVRRVVFAYAGPAYGDFALTRATLFDQLADSWTKRPITVGKIARNNRPIGWVCYTGSGNQGVHVMLDHAIPLAVRIFVLAKQ